MREQSPGCVNEAVQIRVVPFQILLQEPPAVKKNKPHMKQYQGGKLDIPRILCVYKFRSFFRDPGTVSLDLFYILPQYDLCQFFGFQVEVEVEVEGEGEDRKSVV